MLKINEETQKTKIVNRKNTRDTKIHEQSESCNFYKSSRTFVGLVLKTINVAEDTNATPIHNKTDS